MPLILRTITDLAMNDLAALTVSLVFRLAALYLVLRLIDAAAQYFMADMGHVMGVYIETDMRQDAFDHLQRLGLRTICLMCRNFLITARRSFLLPG